MKKIALVISCEHAVNTIPKEYHAAFAPYQSLLQSHQGVDFGALELAEYLTQRLRCDCIIATVSRLLIDCNRSIENPQCFSDVTDTLPLQEKQVLIDRYYHPFRDAVFSKITNHIQQGFAVLHVSVHTFTPILHGVIRNTDIGLLYDPRRIYEKQWANQWKSIIKTQSPYTVRMNYPYKGISNGFTTTLRKQFQQTDYIGIELESNQKLTRNSKDCSNLKILFADSLLSLIHNNLIPNNH